MEVFLPSLDKGDIVHSWTIQALVDGGPFKQLICSCLLFKTLALLSSSFLRVHLALLHYFIN